MATDGTSSGQGYAIVNIYLEDINDNAPKWDISTIEGSVLEGAVSGSKHFILYLNSYKSENLVGCKRGMPRNSLCDSFSRNGSDDDSSW